MFELMIEESFCAAHALRGYNGPCENLHGHTWKVQVFLTGNKLNKIGILIDFRGIKAALKKVLDRFDHQNLNDLPEFKKQNPSCEILAKLVFEKLKKELKGLSKVTVFESEKTSASYFIQSALW
jgi:6-pyruvoyltetrahydropterin/6-carboxytetrahydropterin synthase